MSTLEQISKVNKNGKTLTKFVVAYDEKAVKKSEKVAEKVVEKVVDKKVVDTETKTKDKPKKDSPLRIKITTPKDLTYVYVKSKTPYAMIAKGKVVKTSEHNKKKFYPYHNYLFKKNAQEENYIYLETTTDDGKKYLKKMFKTEFEEITIACEQKTQTVALGTRFSYKRGRFVIEQLGAKTR